MRGSEAILIESEFQGKSCLIKKRIPKSYRLDHLDLKLRKKRTKAEAKILKRLNLAKIPCPEVFRVENFSIFISKINGKKPKDNIKNVKSAAKILAKIHSQNIIHGDYTFANLLLNGTKMYVIDFGLGYFSRKIEDQAMDVFTFFLSLHDADLREEFVKTYLKNSEHSKEIKKRLEQIKKRVRYS